VVERRRHPYPARGNNEKHARTQYGQRPAAIKDQVTWEFKGGTYCVNFHVGGCEPSPASTIFPVLVSVEPAVSLAWKCRLCPASAANGSFRFEAPGSGAAGQDA